MSDTMDFMNPLTFASDAEQFALFGVACVMLSVICQLFAHSREKNRRVDQLEKVGVMPWTGLSLTLGLLGGICLLFSLPVVIGSN